MERESTISKHEMHEKIVQPFLMDAFKEGAHRIKPKYTSQDQWSRRIMIGVVLNDIGSSATSEELADKHGTFRQSISRSNKGFLKGLWNNSSPQLQGRHDLDQILAARKPLSHRSRQIFSLVQGGTSLRIKQVEGGVTDKDRAMKELKRFQKNPVSLVCGQGEVWLPISTLLVAKQGYEAVGRVFNELGKHCGWNFSYSDFFTSDCPVPVFYMGDSHYFYPVGQKEELKSFIANKLNLSVLRIAS